MHEHLPIRERRHLSPEESPLLAIERGKENPVTKAACLAVEALNIPSGAFSGIATYRDAEGREQRIAPELDRAMAQHFTNVRRIVKDINGIGPITTKDPREKYEGAIDAVIEQTKSDLQAFKETVERVRRHLAHQRDLPHAARARAERLICDALELYDMLIGELELKKRGAVFLENGMASFLRERCANTQLGVTYLPGGNIAILREYLHDREGVWQRHFGDNRSYPNGLATIYKHARYVAIEGLSSRKVGRGLQLLWMFDNSKYGYSRLMKELVKDGFQGDFLELDARYRGAFGEKTFDTKNLSQKEAEELFAYQKKYNPDLATAIGTAEHFRELFHKQRTEGFPLSFNERELHEGLLYRKDGTRYHATSSVRKDGSTASVPTGFELGQMAFADALSVIRILIMNEAMNSGALEPGIIVDFQGADHLSLKSFFFDNPAYAMEVVLANVHEILASHPDVKNTEDILQKLAAMDEETWQWVFTFIGTIPFARVEAPTEERDSVEPGLQQRLMMDREPYVATAEAHVDNVQREKIKQAIAVLVRAGRRGRVHDIND